MTATTEPAEATMHGEGTHSAGGALAGLSLATLMASLGTSIANVALPTLAQAFHASFQEAQWVVLAYLLASTTLIVSVGRLGDVAGRRRLLIAGIALFTTASALCGIAPTLSTLIAAPWPWSARPFRRRGPEAPWACSARCRRSAPRWGRRSADS
jgi:hypothetical protein